MTYEDFSSLYMNKVIALADEYYPESSKERGQFAATAALIAREVLPELYEAMKEKGLNIHIDNQRVGFNQALDQVTTTIEKLFGEDK